jgi:SpoVK/Ycf46/Vps4 family AAA+-type ATPase
MSESFASCLTFTQEDSVLFASTNFPDRLDEALRRPGRFDVHVAFDHAVTEQAIDLYKHFYPLSRIQNDNTTETQEKDNEPTTSHPFKDQSDLDRAAEQFAEHIMGKNIKVSIATIQGFLLLYKKDPVMALDKVDEWAEGIRRDQFPESNDLVDEVVLEEEGSAQDVVVEEEDSVKEEIVEQEAAKVEAEKNDEGQKSEPEKQVIVVGEGEKQEVVQEVVLA